MGCHLVCGPGFDNAAYPPTSKCLPRPNSSAGGSPTSALESAGSRGSSSRGRTLRRRFPERSRTCRRARCATCQTKPRRLRTVGRAGSGRSSEAEAAQLDVGPLLRVECELSDAGGTAGEPGARYRNDKRATPLDVTPCISWLPDLAPAYRSCRGQVIAMFSAGSVEIPCGCTRISACYA
jgi:hypothetical protein